MSSRKLMLGLSACLLLCPAVTVAAYGDDDNKQPKVRTVRGLCGLERSKAGPAPPAQLDDLYAWLQLGQALWPSLFST